MPIGLSLSPRGYDIDPTGRSYVLDPDPLIDIQEKAFASQTENMRRVGEVAQEGVKVAEYIGARQQLGRVKAQLGDLDINDPQFAQKYSAIVADNPLAFVNEKIAPVTKAAIAPVLGAAAQAMESRAALERAQVMAGQYASRAATNYGYQIGRRQWENQNPRPAAPHRPTAGEMLLFGSPQAAPSGAPMEGTSDQTYTDPGNDLLLPTDPEGLFPVPEGEQLLPDLDSTQEGPAFTSEDMIEGQGDGAVNTLQNGVLNTPTGAWRVKNVSADGVTVEPQVLASPPPQNLVPPGMRAVPEFDASGNPTAYKLVPEPDSAVGEKELLDIIVNSDPLVAETAQRAAASTAAYDGLKSQITNLPDDQKAAMAPQLAEASVAAAGATAQAKMVADQTRLVALAQRDPRAAQVLAQRQMEETMRSIPVQGPTQDMLVAPPLPAPVAAAVPPPAAEQFRAQNNPAVMKTWDEEKRFALDQARDLERQLNLAPNTVINAVASKDGVQIHDILMEARKRGISSPLLTEINIPSTGSASPPSGKTTVFKRSTKLGRSYRDILQMAVEDPNYNKFYNKTPAGRAYTAEPFVKTK